MKLIAWGQLKIGTRVLAIALLPVLVMFCFIAVSTYFSPLEEAEQELAERGHLLATAFAESGDARAYFGANASNSANLKRMAENLAQFDRSICQIRILDAAKHETFHIDFNSAVDAERRTFEAPIRNLPDGPNLSGVPQDGAPGQALSAVKGYVGITISLSKVIEHQKRRIYEQSALALLALLVISVFVLWLTRSLTAPLDAAVASLRAIRSGDFNVRVDVTTGGEIGELQSAIVEMTRSLQLSKEDLENQVLTRTRDLVASRNMALRSDAEKRKLIHKVNTIVEDERKSIAIEIHDVLNADLIAVRLDSQRILKLAGATALAPANEEIRKKAQAIIDTTLGIYASARSIVRRLRPEVLETLGLHGAVEEMVRHYDLAHPVCQFYFQSDGDFLKLESSLAIAAYRLIQEALSNVVKHSKASKCSVSLLAEEDFMLKITIIDNGVGFDMQAMNQGIGIIGMRERVYAVGGKIDIRSGVGHGTEIVICFAY